MKQVPNLLGNMIIHIDNPVIREKSLAFVTSYKPCLHDKICEVIGLPGSSAACSCQQSRLAAESRRHCYLLT